jgi:pimeloyl-ACP methyl ester carboxylesterase
MPVLALAASYYPVFGGNISMPGLIYGMKILAQDARAVIVPNSGHWIAEEQPQFVIKQLASFFSGSNSTKTSK